MSETTTRTREYYQEIGRRGGRATAAKYGRVHMSTIGRRGWLVTTARYFLGSERLHATWLATAGAYVYWRESGLTMKRDADGRPVWPEALPTHPAETAATGQRSLFEAQALRALESLPF